MTENNETPGPAEQPAQDVSLSVLTMAYPAFRFSFLSAGFHRAKWLGLRKKPAEPGPQATLPADSDNPADADPD